MINIQFKLKNKCCLRGALVQNYHFWLLSEKHAASLQLGHTLLL